MGLSAVLDRLVGYTAAATWTDPARLRPGLAPADLTAILRAHRFPYRPPRDWLELYQWHDGVSGDLPDGRTGDDGWQLFHYHRFYPICEALAVYEFWMAFNAEEGAQVYDPRLLPVFGYKGEYYAVECGDAEAEAALVHFVYHDDSVAYDSLTRMLSSLLECYAAGAYRVVEGETIVDEVAAAAIKRRWNPARAAGILAGHWHP